MILLDGAPFPVLSSDETRQDWEEPSCSNRKLSLFVSMTSHREPSERQIHCACANTIDGSSSGVDLCFNCETNLKANSTLPTWPSPLSDQYHDWKVGGSNPSCQTFINKIACVHRPMVHVALKVSGVEKEKEKEV